MLRGKNGTGPDAGRCTRKVQSSKVEVQSKYKVELTMSQRRIAMVAASAALMMISVMSFTVSLSAQWIHYPTAGIPRTADGKPNLTAPAPRTADGKPDLS